MNNQLNEGMKNLIKSNLTHAHNLLYGGRLNKDTKDKIAHAISSVMQFIDGEFCDTATHTPTPKEMRKVVNYLANLKSELPVFANPLDGANFDTAIYVCDKVRRDLKDLEASE